jgi:hypothetical protein
MKALLFSEFFEGSYDDAGYELYVIKEPGGIVMYIGISKESVWHRWFGGGTSHMDRDASGQFYGKSYIGEVIARRLPQSWNWVIELWTKEDCLSVCRKDIRGRNINDLGIELVEPFMIAKFEPLYNVIHGGGRHEDPLITKKLDQIYRNLFG